MDSKKDSKSTVKAQAGSSQTKSMDKKTTTTTASKGNSAKSNKSSKK